MKTTRILLAFMVGIFFAGTAKAQFKVGENPLHVGDERVWEAEKSDTLMILTDDMRFGRTINKTTNATGDALMMKLFGYGLGQFNTTPKSYFLGTDGQGRVIEFPLTFDLVTNASTATLSLYDGHTNFASVDLTMLDSVFSTNTQLTNAITVLETQINDAKSSDNDSITGNEWIANISLESISDSLIMVFTENISGIGPQHISRIELGFAVYEYLRDTFERIREEIADTATTLRGLTFYYTDGTLSNNRTVDGNNNNLTFTDLNNLAFSSNGTSSVSSAGNITVTSTSGNVATSGGNISTTASGTTDITGTGNISVSSTGGNINSSGTDINSTASGVTNMTSSGDITLSSTSGDINLSGDSISVTGAIKGFSYGTGANTGTEAFLIAVDAQGNFIEVDIADIGGNADLSACVDLDKDGVPECTVDDAIQAANRAPDSTIYKFNGTLTAQRYMTMDGNNLHFINGGDTTVITSDGRMAIGRGTVTNAIMTGRTIRLDVNGDILAQQIHSSSDFRFKKNITGVTNALDKVMAINGVTYDFRTDEFPDRSFPHTRQLGFIAQNVEEVAPEVVATNSDGYKAVDYAKLTALLNEAIKEQQSQISAQASTIEEQQVMLNALLQQNAQLTSAMAEIKSLLNQSIHTARATED